jgi:uncharacterized protein
MKKKFSWLVVYVIAFLTMLCFIPLRQLRFEFDMEKLFPADDPELAFFQDFQEEFRSHGNDEFIYIGLRNNGSIFDPAFLKKVDTLTRYIKRHDAITKIYSLTSTNVLSFHKDTLNARPLLQYDKPARYAADSAYLFASPEYRNLLVSKDGRSVAVAAFNKMNLTDAQKDGLLQSLESKIAELNFHESHLAAKIRVERVYVREIKKNLVVYLSLSLLLISICLYVLFRSIKAILVPLLIIVISLVWTLSLISLTGNALDIISSLLPPILAAICMSDIIHLSNAYIEQLREGRSKSEALKMAYKEVGLATFFTCCTVAVGFITLSITNIIPIRNFGLFAAAGILMAFAVALTMLFAFFDLTPVPSVARRKNSDSLWSRALAFSFAKVLQHKVAILLGLVLLTAVGFIGVSRIEINSSLLQEVPRNHPMLGDYRFMEKDFAGTRPFEMVLTMKDPSAVFSGIEQLTRVEKLERYLNDSLHIGNIISPVALYKGANKSFSGGGTEFYRLPSNPQQAARFHEAIVQTEYADELENYLSADGRTLRISGRLPDLKISEFEALQNKLEQHFISSGFSSDFDFHLTGSGVLLDRITYSLTNNLMLGIAIDAILIAFISLLLLRNWRVVLIVLIPNVVPLVVMGGVMGFMGINLKSDTSVIFTIAFAIAVDDTIHFLSRIRLELSRGLSLPYAIKRTYLSTGKAIVMTALVLITGFSTLLFSSFGGAFYIGLLVTICLSCAVIMDLTVLPVLLLLIRLKPRQPAVEKQAALAAC